MIFKQSALASALALSLLSACGPQKQAMQAQPPTTIESGNGTGLELTAEDKQAGTLKGYLAFNTTIGERLFDKAEDLNLGYYLGSSSLVELLGRFSGSGDRAGLVNATPNSMNILLWSMLVDGFAADIASLCEGNEVDHKGFHSQQLRRDIRQTIDDVCKSGDDADQLAVMWRQWTLYDSTPAELDAWRLSANAIFSQAKGSAAVHQLVYALLFSPHMLIKR